MSQEVNVNFFGTSTFLIFTSHRGKKDVYCSYYDDKIVTNNFPAISEDPKVKWLNI